MEILEAESLTADDLLLALEHGADGGAHLGAYVRRRTRWPAVHPRPKTHHLPGGGLGVVLGLGSDLGLRST